MIKRPITLRLLPLALLAYLAAGCVSAPPPLEEFSGNPHVAIAKLPRRKVAERLIETMLASGYALGHYRLIRGRGYEIRFSKKVGSQTDPGLANFFGNGEAPAPSLTIICLVDRNPGKEVHVAAKVISADPTFPAEKAHPFINAENHRIQNIFNNLRKFSRKK